jgi:ankyrin repeat protein
MQGQHLQGMSTVDKNGLQLCDLIDQFSFQYPYNPTKIDECRKLIEAKANINIVDQAGNSPLLKAVFAGCLVHRSDYVKLLIEAHANVDVQNTEGFTPLMLAASKGNYAICSMLINAKANINMRNSQGFTALMLAAHSGNYEICQMLINAKADITIRNKNGGTALMLALENGDVNVIVFLSKANLECYQRMLRDTWLQAPVEICNMIPTFVYEE